MGTKRKRRLVVVVALLVVGTATICPAGMDGQGDVNNAASVENRVADLENQVSVLKQEIAKLTSAQTANASGASLVPASTTAPAATSSSAVSATPASSVTPAASSAPAPLDGIAGVLEGATVTGIVDTFYAYNANQPANRTSALRLFDARTNQFALNLIELGLVKTPSSDSRIGYNITFGFGDAMNVINAGDPSFLQHLKEAYGSYLAPVGKGLQFDVGKFVTPAGAEVIENNLDWNYSRSLLFDYAIPFYHFGMRAKYAFSDKYAVTGYVVNGWNNVVQDQTNHFDNSGKTGGVGFAWTPTKKFSIAQSWLGGPGATPLDGNGWRNLSDTVVAYSPTDRLSFMLNGDYGRSERTTVLGGPVDWSGVAAYARVRVNKNWSVASRYEYYNDHTGFTTGTPQHIQEVTGTVQRRFAQHLISRFEYRHDMSNRDFFPKGGDNSLVKGQSTIAAGLIFVMEPSESK